MPTFASKFYAGSVLYPQDWRCVYICETSLPLQLMDWLAYVTCCDLTDDKGGNPASKTRFIAH